jgi:ABC-type dipeptide/oligopeptide/nickel transport system ATPase component
MDDARVRCQNLWVGYRIKSARGLPRRGQTSWALQGVDLVVAPGELVGIIGGNGSGKPRSCEPSSGCFDRARANWMSAGKWEGWSSSVPTPIATCPCGNEW